MTNATQWKVPFEWTDETALPERILCDTNIENGPTIHLFEAEGWTRGAAYERPVSPPVEPH